MSRAHPLQKKRRWPVVLLWLGCLGAVLALILLCCLLAEPSQAALPKMPKLDGVKKSAGPVEVFEGLFNLIANFVLIVLAVAVVVVVAVQIISEVHQARTGEGRWRRAFATSLGGIAVIILVVYLVNFASKIIS